MDDTSFSLRHNAKRAAERMIEAGTAPSIDFGIRTLDSGRFEIAWRTGLIEPEAEAEYPGSFEDDDGTEPREHGLDYADAEDWPIEDPTNEPDEPEPEPEPIAGKDPWPARAPVKIRASGNKQLTGTIVDRVDLTHWRVQLDFAAAGATSVYDGADFEAGAVTKPWTKSLAKPQRSPSAAPARPKSTELDGAASRGVMPEKPLITSRANLAYQKRFDHLADRAAAGDWSAVEAYEINGVNSYAKMLKQYRDRLLAAHAASAQDAAADIGRSTRRSCQRSRSSSRSRPRLIVTSGCSISSRSERRRMIGPPPAPCGSRNPTTTLRW